MHQLGFGLHHTFGHFRADRGLVCEVAEVTRQFAVNVLMAGFFKISLDDFFCVGGGVVFAHQFSGPEAHKLVAACFCLELHFCVVGEFVFECVFAIIKTGYWWLPLLFVPDMPTRALARKGGLAYDATYRAVLPSLTPKETGPSEEQNGTS